MSSSSYSTAYKGPGNTISVTAPYAVVGGQGVLVGSLFGVAARDAASGDAVSIEITGRYSLSKLTTDGVVVGNLLYWDNTNKRLTLTSTSNKLVGVAVTAAAAGVTTVEVLLTGQVA